MKTVVKLFVGAGLLVAVAAVSGDALGLERGQWPSMYRDPANTVNTDVDLYDPAAETLKVLWEARDPLRPYYRAPRVHSYTDSEGKRVQMVISVGLDGHVLDAWTGESLLEGPDPVLPDFPDVGRPEYSPAPAAPPQWFAIDTVTDILVTTQDWGTGHKLVTYDLKAKQRGWELPLQHPDLVIDKVYVVTAKNGVFYVTGWDTTTEVPGDVDPYWHKYWYEPGVVAIDAATGALRWQILLTGWSPLIDFPAVGRPPGETEDWFYMSIDYQLGDTVYPTLPGGIVAIAGDPGNPGDGKVQWEWVYNSGDPAPGTPGVHSVDETTGLVFATFRIDVSPDRVGALIARDAKSGAIQWTVEFNGFANGVPTLGVVDGTPAVFVVNLAGVVYAFNRADGAQLYQADIPDAVCHTAVYAAGRLYIGAVNHEVHQAGVGETYVLDANTGEVVATLETDGARHDDFPGARVIAEVLDDNGQPQSVMYYVTYDYSLTALSTVGTQIAQVSLQADPPTIGAHSTSTVTATYKFGPPGDLQPVEGITVNFSSDAAKTQGSLSATSAVTDANGVATTTFESHSRDGTVTVTSRARYAEPASVAINITKGGGEEPPPETGTIKGTVYDDATGERVKGATVTATNQDTGEFVVAVTKKRGTYKFTDLPTGTYHVHATKDGLSDEKFDVVLGAGETVTVNLTLQ